MWCGAINVDHPLCSHKYKMTLSDARMASTCSKRVSHRGRRAELFQLFVTLLVPLAGWEISYLFDPFLRQAPQYRHTIAL
jgi:hypothetical protein